MENLREFIDVRIVVFGKKALIFVKEKKNLPNMKWRVKVVHEGNVIYKERGYTRQKRRILDIQDVGCWIIFVEAIDKDHSFFHIRESFWNYSKEQKKSYRSFLTKKYEKESDIVPLAELRKPYQNLGLIYEANKREKKIDWKGCIKKIDLSLHLYEQNISKDQSITVISQQEKKNIGEDILFFSGKTKYNKKLIFGQDDIQEDSNIDELLDDVGYFSAVHCEKKYITFTNDYFGIYSLYFYENESVCIVANSFHLMILLLKHSNISLELDVDHIIPYFTCGERMLFEQLASHQTFIKGVRKVPIHSKLTINKEGYKWTDKSIAQIMRSPMPYNEETYEKLLKKYSSEIVENIEIARSDDRFDYVIMDVSGGKDSRVMLAAAMKNAPEGDDRIRINSVDVPAKKDKASFIPLNHIHPFQYDNRGETLKVADIGKKIVQRRSVYMGTLFSHMMPWKYERITDQATRLQLTGAGGDMLLCAYFPMSFPQMCYDSESKLVESYCPLYNNGVINYKQIKPYIYNLINEGIGEVIGKDPYEKLNNYYLYFRNAYHFGPEVLFTWMESSREQWFPLYSKTGFLIRQMISQKFKGIRFSLDLIDELEPILLKIPFNDPKYNKELKVKNAKFNKSCHDVEVKINQDSTLWDEAQKEKTNTRKIINNAEEQRSVEKEGKMIVDNFYDTAMKKMNQMLNYDKRIEKMVGLDLYLKFKKNEDMLKKKKASREFCFLYNKIISVTDLIDIIEKN